MSVCVWISVLFSVPSPATNHHSIRSIFTDWDICVRHWMVFVSSPSFFDRADLARKKIAYDLCLCFVLRCGLNCVLCAPCKRKEIEFNRNGIFTIYFADFCLFAIVVVAVVPRRLFFYFVNNLEVFFWCWYEVRTKRLYSLKVYDIRNIFVEF